MNNTTQTIVVDSGVEEISNSAVDQLTIYSAVVLIAFLLAVFFVIRPIEWTIDVFKCCFCCCKHKGEKLVRFKLGFVTAPLLAVLLLICVGALPLSNVWDGVVGVDTLHPYSIVLLFFSLSYMSVSLDVTGLLSAASLHLIGIARGSGPRFFFIVFTLSSLLTILTSNDIVILTLTPILLYACACKNLIF
jgi:hypothetical protein